VERFKKEIGNTVGHVLFLMINAVMILFILLQARSISNTRSVEISTVINEGRRHYLVGGSVDDNPYRHTEYRDHWVMGYIAAHSEITMADNEGQID
jgi:ribosome modulation factor